VIDDETTMTELLREDFGLRGADSHSKVYEQTIIT
jgi:hypothetical protein